MKERLLQWTLPVFAIALNSYREAIRSKVLGSLVFLPILMLGLGSFAGEMSLHNEVRVSTNLGLFLTAIFGVIVSIYASITLFHTEFERRTIYTLLSKPIQPWQLLVGKLFGVSGICLTAIVIMGLTTAFMVIHQGGAISSAFVAGMFCVLLQSFIVAGLTIFFASFSGSLLAGFFSFGVFVAGNLMDQLELSIAHFRESSPAAVPFLELVAAILPNLSALNLSYEVTYSVPVPGSYVLSALWYACSYVGVCLAVAVMILHRRDIQ